MPKHKNGPEMDEIRAILKKKEVTLEDLQNLRAEHPKVFGQLDDREELEALITDHLNPNDQQRAVYLLEAVVEAAYWHGYNVAESEVDSDN